MSNPRPKAFWFIVGSLVLSWLLWNFSDPFVLLRRTKLELGPLEAETARLQQENLVLKQQVEGMKTAQAMEMEAHRQGWVKPGERRLVFVEPPSAQPPLVIPQKDEDTSAFARARSWAAAKAAVVLRRSPRT